MEIHRPEITGSGVILSGPNQFYRCIGLIGPGYGHGFQYIVTVFIGPPPKAATGKQCINFNLFRRQAQSTGNCIVICLGLLAAIPYLCTGLGNLIYTVHRLHGGMGQIGKLKLRLNNLGGIFKALLNVAFGQGW